MKGSGSAEASQASGRHPGLTLTDAVVRGIDKAPPQEPWPTPASRDWKSSASHMHGRNSRPLNEVVRLEAEAEGAARSKELAPETGLARELGLAKAKGAARSKELAPETGLASGEAACADASADVDGASSGLQATLALDADELFPTPSAQSYGSNRGGAAGRVGKKRDSLESMARTWPTPTAEIGTGYRTGSAGDVWRPNLEGAVNGLQPQRINPEPWATPQARDDKGPSGMAGRAESGGRRSSLSDQTMPGQTAGRLNPGWVLQLMGFPGRWLTLPRPSKSPSTASRQAVGKRSTRGKSRGRSKPR